jgi:hypothetical protein
MLKVSLFTVTLCFSPHVFAQEVPAPVPPANPASTTATPGVPTGCYPGKQNGEDVLFCPRPAPVPTTPTTTAAPAAEGPQEWYGWQTLLADGASVALVIGGATIASGSGSSSNSNSRTGSALAGLGSLGYLVGGPIVHLANGRPFAGLGSLGLRAGLPVGGAILGGLIGLGTCKDSSRDFGSGLCVLAIGTLGFVGGVVAAVVADAVWLARKPTELAKPQQAVRWIPDLSLSPTGGSAGVRGTF